MGFIMISLILSYLGSLEVTIVACIRQNQTLDTRSLLKISGNGRASVSYIRYLRYQIQTLSSSCLALYSYVSEITDFSNSSIVSKKCSS